MTRRLAFLLAAGLLCAAPLQAQIVAWQGAATVYTSPILIPRGTLGNPAIGFAGDADGTGSGIWSPGANLVDIDINGNDYHRFGISNYTLRSDSGSISLGIAADTTFSRSGTAGAFRISGGTTPTGAGCGTGASYAGNNSNGAVTIGTTPGTCVITFNGTWNVAPHCTLNNERAAGAGGHRATGITTTQFTITGTLAATDVISWSCWGP